MLDLDSLAQWIQQTPYSQFVRGSRNTFPLFVPIALVLHLLGIAAIVGSSLLVGLRLQGLVGKSMPVSEVSRRMLPWIWTAVPVMILSGATVLSNRPGRYLHNPIFQIKMGLLATAILVTLAVHRIYARQVTPRAAEGAAARIAGAGLIAVWIATLFAGRWIPYAY